MLQERMPTYQPFHNLNEWVLNKEYDFTLIEHDY